jgi:O-antigen/teichoic acid export membrane protein
MGKERSTAKKIMGNASWLFIEAVLSRLLSFLLVIYLARRLGSLNFGKLSFANAFVQIFIIFADLGISFLTIREVARDKQSTPEFIGSGFILKILLATGTFGLIFAAINITDCPRDTKQVVYLIGLCYIFESLGDFFGSVFKANEKMQYSALIDIAEKIFMVSLCLIFLFLGYGLIAMAFIYLICGIIYNFLNIFFVIWKFARPKIKIDCRFWKYLLKNGLPFALGGILIMAFYYTDTVMLAWLKGERVVGWYGVSFNLVHALGMLPSAFLTAAFPVFSRFFKTSTDSLNQAYRGAFKFLLLLGMPISAGGMLLAERIIRLLFGENYLPSIAILRIIISAVAFTYLNSLFGYFLASIDKQMDSLKMLGIAVVMNILLNLMLIPRYSYVGAAVATVISQFFFLLFFLFYISKTPYHYFPLRLIAKTIFACLIMAVVILLFKSLNLLLLIIISIVVYFLIVLAIRYFDAQDRLILRQMIKR